MRHVNNGNWTEWSAIWVEIIRVISKSNEHVAPVRFEITSMISDQNCTIWGSITTLLHPFWNCPNTELSQFKYFIDAVLSRFEIKFIHFFGGVGGNKWLMEPLRNRSKAREPRAKEIMRSLKNNCAYRRLKNGCLSGSRIVRQRPFWWIAHILLKDILL